MEIVDLMKCDNSNNGNINHTNEWRAILDFESEANGSIVGSIGSRTIRSGLAAKGLAQNGSKSRKRSRNRKWEEAASAAGGGGGGGGIGRRSPPHWHWHV